ncbi:MAG: copper-binding protein [Chelatococcus sp.]|nr:MAG: copper-binding protein [Chelatococcus sp.]
MSRRAILIAMSVLVAAILGAVVAVMSTNPFAGSREGAGALRLGGPFSLVDQNGVETTDRTFLGAPFAIFFGFTHCPDICPTKLFEMSEVLRAAGPRGEKLRALFVTVDPERDTPEVMKNYLGSFDGRIVGLSGSRQAIEAAMRAYRVYARKVPLEGGDYTMDHTALVFLVGKDGSVVGVLNVEEAPEKAAAEWLKHL